MIQVAIMIEGQNGLNWPHWQRIATAVEALGFAGLYRSDHYTNANPPDKDSLELWVSLTWLASHTRRIEFGPLVTPFSFRQPTMTARMASAVDDLSGGRLTLGVGAGWQQREHHNYGWELLDVPGRFARFEEGLEVITRLLHSDQPVDFQGRFYRLHEAILLPRSLRPGGPPILIGGNGQTRTLPLVARYASEWNGVFLTPARFADLNSRLDELLVAQGRRPEDARRSVMVGTEFGRDTAEVTRKVAARTAGRETPATLREKGLVVGVPGEVVEQLKQYEAAGVQRIMLQWLALDDLDGLEALAQTVLPQL
ncbi:MAG: LLM class F420-dependent oxidoreductase [Chloroflexi bacterium]|nr:LLM class F420-dependent oxidoreductase [Chloroflexota bacterium]MCI0577135.1 LLM class F420-dependent oxidoreductase [Chloroflexota bacterium]MCI0644675.1 LLM class F420-dependent oxidoreductase [Chloroflexota bacterium]MCI0730373.1 LLM class F420-dependent oxidoreductase [Chloroflexota bacterium]